MVYPDGDHPQIMDVSIIWVDGGIVTKMVGFLRQKIFNIFY